MEQSMRDFGDSIYYLHSYKLVQHGCCICSSAGRRGNGKSEEHLSPCNEPTSSNRHLPPTSPLTKSRNSTIEMFARRPDTIPSYGRMRSRRLDCWTVKVPVYVSLCDCLAPLHNSIWRLMSVNKQDSIQILLVNKIRFSMELDLPRIHL